jgi:ergothioneine biosynthesis protein EgtB
MKGLEWPEEYRMASPFTPRLAGGADPDLASRFEAVRNGTEALAEGLSAEDCALQSMPDASPVKWHLAHTTWFFETFLLEPNEPAFEPFDASFRVLFNSYYNAVGPKHPRPERGMLSRPPLERVLAYRAQVSARMLRFLQTDRARELAALVELGLHHEQQHQELILTDFKHLLSRNPLHPVYRARSASLFSPAPVVPLEWIAFPEGLRRIGHEDEGFAFDNEGPRHRVFLEAFELASRPVTNGEFMAFMEDGGYRRPELWLSDGWNTVCEQGWEAPLYWQRERESWHAFTLAGLLTVDPAEPVTHVSYFEADAYARWANARLPTEAEWEVAAASQPVSGNFADTGRFHPSAAPPSTPFTQMFGDVWEWTQSPYAPYPRFRPAAGAVGEYNGKFMCNQYVLRGGSCATPAGHVRATYRNFFPAPARWQFSGLRLARDRAP